MGAFSLPATVLVDDQSKRKMLTGRDIGPEEFVKWINGVTVNFGKRSDRAGSYLSSNNLLNVMPYKVLHNYVYSH